MLRTLRPPTFHSSEKASEDSYGDGQCSDQPLHPPPLSVFTGLRIDCGLFYSNRIRTGSLCPSGLASIFNHLPYSGSAHSLSTTRRRPRIFLELICSSSRSRLSPAHLPSLSSLLQAECRETRPARPPRSPRSPRAWSSGQTASPARSAPRSGTGSPPWTRPSSPPPLPARTARPHLSRRPRP